ncbi:ATP-dependent DNA helicase II subunit 1 [[Candida] anglica]
MSDQDPDLTYRQYEIREGIIFLIELTPDIFLPLEQLNYKSQFHEILLAINELISELVISLPSTGIGIYLYNCATTGTNFKKDSGINKIFTLNDVNSKNMKILNDLIQDDINNVKRLEDLFSVKRNTDNEYYDNLPIVLNSMLNICNMKTHYNNKKVIWFTNNDNPYNNDKGKKRLWKIINDFEEYKINISPLFLDKFESGEKLPFDMKKFRNIFLNYGEWQEANDDHSGDEENTTDIKVENENSQYFDQDMKRRITSKKLRKTTLSTTLRSYILRLKEIKRVQFSCNLILSDGTGSKGEIGGEFGCSIKGYSMYNHEKPRRFESIYNKGETSQIVHVKTKYIDATTNEEIPTNAKSGESNDGGDDDSQMLPQIKKGYATNDTVFYLNDKQLHYLKNYTFDHTPDGISEPTEDEDEDELETAKLEYSEPAYLKLIGFRKLENFKPYYNTSNPIFVTADINNGLRLPSSAGGFENSFATFSSLYQSCVALKRFAVLFGCTKKNSTPSMYGLYPTRVVNSTKNNTSNFSSFKEFPEGFFLIRLPWVDDIRSIPEYILTNGKYLSDESLEGDESTNELIENYKMMINEFGLKSYQPNKTPNPTLNYFYKVLRMHLLQMPSESDPSKEIVENDQTIESLINVHNHLCGKQKEINQTRNEIIKYLNMTLNRLSNESINNKRQYESEGGVSKKAKTEEVVLTDSDVLTAWKKNTWTYFNVAQLRTFISKHKGKIKKATRRADMIDNITEFLEERYGASE